MYLIGVWLAAYYEWWLRRTVKRPGLWELCFGIVQFPIIGALWLLPPMWMIVLYFAAVVLLVPAFFAAFKNRKKQAEQDANAWGRMRHVQKLIKLGKKDR